VSQPDAVRMNAVSDPGADWIVLPTVRAGRWFLPREPPSLARAGLSVYHPVTWRSRVGWEAARAMAGRGWFRIGSGSCLLPREVWDAANHLIPEGGGLSVSRANHPGRFLGLVFDREGRSTAFVKVARDTMGLRALEAERAALESFRGFLSAPLLAPEILDHADGVLVFGPVHWYPRSRPWRLPETVSFALGSFFRRTAGEGGALGAAHGDFAPWNLLRTDEGWALVDWEGFRGSAPPFFDLFHYLVQSNSELHRPSARSIIYGLHRNGWIGGVIAAYAEGAGLDVRMAPPSLRAYLETTASEIEPGAPGRSSRVRVHLMRILASSAPSSAGDRR
jgi:hypothetical protein